MDFTLPSLKTKLLKALVTTNNPPSPPPPPPPLKKKDGTKGGAIAVPNPRDIGVGKEVQNS